MQSLIVINFCIISLQQTASARYFPNSAFEKNSDDRSVPSKDIFANDAFDVLISTNDSSEIYNASENGYMESSQLSIIESSSVSNPTSTGIIHSTSTSNRYTEIFSNESHSHSSIEYSSSESSQSNNSTKSSVKFITVTLSNNESSSEIDDDEPEGVARGKPNSTESADTTTLQPQTVYQRTLALISDTYTLSILVPVAAGVVFASVIIVTIATCRCLKRRCRRRRLHKKTLPDSVKNLRPSDRARLLAESSDEEF